MQNMCQATNNYFADLNCSNPLYWVYTPGNNLSGDVFNRKVRRTLFWLVKYSLCSCFSGDLTVGSLSLAYVPLHPNNIVHLYKAHFVDGKDSYLNEEEVKNVSNFYLFDTISCYFFWCVNYNVISYF